MNKLALPRIANATLPATYERARDALDTCERIDECKDWADKAAALASYAKQADDQTLHKLATRIQARAVRRAGELLRTFNQGRGGDRKSDQSRSAPTLITQREAAAAAGFSKNQEVNAVRVANVPADDFEEAVESDTPPTVTTLAARGTVSRPTAKAPGVADATRLIGLLSDLAEFCKTHAAGEVVVGLFSHEMPALHRHIDASWEWLKRFRQAMEDRANDEQVHRRAGARRDKRGA